MTLKNIETIKINLFASSNTQRGMVTQINQTKFYFIYEVGGKFMKRNKRQFES